MYNLVSQAQAAANKLNSIDSDITSVDSLFTKTTNLISLVAGMIAFIYLVYSGILYLTAAGNPDSAKKGQQGIINAIIGIIIIVAAWAIIGAIRGTSADLTKV